MPHTHTNPIECYEDIGRWLSEAVPEPWKNITIDFEIEEIDDVCEYCIVYRPTSNERLEKQFFVDDTRFYDCFYQLARLTSTIEKGFYKKCHFVLNHDGCYEVDFEY